MKSLMTSRRTLIKATAFSGLAAAIDKTIPIGLIEDAKAAGAAAKVEASAGGDTKIVKTCCRGCIQNCGVLAHVRNGRVVKLEGNPEYPMSHGATAPRACRAQCALPSGAQQVSVDPRGQAR